MEFHPLSDAEMEEYLTEKGIEDDLTFIAHLCGNCPCLLEEIIPDYPSLKELYSELKCIRRREDLLAVFHLVQEKDPSEFYSTHAGLNCSTCFTGCCSIRCSRLPAWQKILVSFPVCIPGGNSTWSAPQ